MFLLPSEGTYEATLLADLRHQREALKLTSGEVLKSWIASEEGSFVESKDPRHLLRILRYQAVASTGLFTPEERIQIQASFNDNIRMYIGHKNDPSGLYYSDSMYELLRIELKRDQKVLEALDSIRPESAFMRVNLSAFRLVLACAYRNITDILDAVKKGNQELQNFTDELWDNEQARYAIRLSQDFPIELRLIAQPFHFAARFLGVNLEGEDPQTREIFSSIDAEFAMISRIQSHELPESLNGMRSKSEARALKPIKIGACEKIFSEPRSN